MMARPERILTARGLAALTEPGRYADGGGLYLFISASGGRSWVWHFQWQGKTREMGLGSVSAVGLREARDARDKWRAVLQQGRDPIAERKAAAMASAVPTFWECAHKLIESKAKGWRNTKHRAQWPSTLATHAAALKDRPVDQIDTAAVLAVLKPIWNERAETASRVRGRIEAVLDWARAHDYCSGENPARWRGHMDKLLPRRQALARGHHAALPYQDCPAFMAELRAREAVTALALEFCILTACRSGEVLGARWSEIDTKERVWTIPAARMKAGREHRVPLSPRAVEILGAVEGHDERLIFAGRKRGVAMSGPALTKLMRRMGRKNITVHGFRSSFRDWAGDCSHFPREVAEAALAHIVGDKAEQAYRRGSAMEKRRELMTAWAAFLAGEPGARVLPFKRAGN